MEQSSFKGALTGLGFLFALLLVLSGRSFANVVLIGNNISLSFDDIEANFVSTVKGSGICGILQLTEPFDACSPLTNKEVSGKGPNSPIALIIRGACSFETKVRNAQDAGFSAAIVYNNEDGSDLIAMGGNSKGITIYAVFVSKAAGEVLFKYAGNPNMECWIVPSLENTSWLVMAVSFASLLVISAVLASFFFLRRQQLRHESRHSRVHHFHGMSSRRVRELPSLTFSHVADDKCTSQTCAICLEDYTNGEKLRVLPCCHKFHALCIDSWLTMWRTFCPVCKRDARTTGEPAATESTPLLSTSLSLTSIRSAQSLVGSPPMRIPSSSLLSNSQNVSLCLSRPLDSCDLSLILRKNSGNFGNTSQNTSLLPLDVRSPLFTSQNSLDVHGLSPMSVGSRHESPFIPGTYNASPQFDGSFCHHPPIPSCGGSFVSPFHSTNSLPGFQDVMNPRSELILRQECCV